MRGPRLRSRFVRVAAVALAMAIAAAGLRAFVRRDAGFPRRSLEIGGGGVAFVDESACSGCHARQADAWRRSHHASAMLPASDATVAGDFDDAAFTQFGVTTRFRRDGDRFLVDAEGPKGEMRTYEVRYTFGVDPLQQYLVAFGGGRLQALTVAWDTDRRAWFSLQPDERIMPSDPRHWTGRLNRWNDRCAECHSTDLRVRYDTASHGYATTWAAVNVGCQACHGPGARHVDWAGTSAATSKSRTNRESGAPTTATAANVGLLVDPGESANAELWTCAGCHSRRGRASAEDAHGRAYLDDFSIALLREELYHADGQILDEVYVTGSFLQSRMHRRGVSCRDCHDPHTGALHAPDNSLCARCHRPNPPAAFPTLRSASYDTTAHHRHVPGAPGSACVDCHMPGRVYMEVDVRRDHSLRVPRPDLSVALGTPNACTQCHEDRTPAWAASAIDGWYARPARPDHFARAIAAGRARSRDAAPLLHALARDTMQPGIARATALALLADASSDDARSVLVDALGDRDPLVRLAAVDALALSPPASRTTLLLAPLRDSIAAVRSAAARLLAPLGPALTDPADRRDLARALEEYAAVQHAQADQPEAHFNLGSLATDLGDLSTAETEYRKALALDSTFLPASVNLATMYNGQGRNVEAEQLLRHALGLAPEEGELHYSLGLLLAELGRLPEAVVALGAAAQRLPDRARVHYNYGLALQKTGRLDEAEAALRSSYDLAPDDPTFAAGLVFLYRARQRWDEAATYAQRVLDLMPGDEGARQLWREIEMERHR